jgi:hypothetical protein
MATLTAYPLTSRLTFKLGQKLSTYPLVSGQPGGNPILGDIAGTRITAPADRRVTQTGDVRITSAPPS